jgi:hypothetical protein
MYVCTYTVCTTMYSLQMIPVHKNTLKQVRKCRGTQHFLHCEAISLLFPLLQHTAHLFVQFVFFSIGDACMEKWAQCLLAVITGQ